MSDAVIHFHPTGTLVALVGNPNSGKSALFNRLTGSRQKVANYAGVTVERKEGKYVTTGGRVLRILDLPGTYSLNPRSLDERVTCDVLAGRFKAERRPHVVVCVVDATNLRRHLRLLLAVLRQGLPCVVALNMSDVAEQRGIHVDAAKLSTALGVPVVKTIAVKASGDNELRALLDDVAQLRAVVPASPDQAMGDHETVNRILSQLGLTEAVPHTMTERVDRVVLHPVIGPLLLAVLLFVMFQSVFLWAEAPMTAIKEATSWAGAQVSGLLPNGWIRSLLVDGIIAGIGGVIVFLPQILILFFFILLLEESGYLPRAAFLLDRIMGSVGLSGRSFIPLLSSFACAIPGIIATRTIADRRDRIVTIMIAPLMTCSARLPVYALVIGAFIPQREVWGLFKLQGIVLFVLYIAGIIGAMGVAWVLKRFTAQGRQTRPLMMELPNYHWPTVAGIGMGLWQRVVIFMRRVGGVILLLTILLWFLASFPGAPSDSTGPAIEHSIAGMIGHALEYVLAPIGFNWQICIALVPGMAAREVAVSSLATVYALSATGDNTAQALSPLISQSFSLATAFSLLAWYVFAPQCVSTLATVKRETGDWKMPIFMAGYLFALAYAASFVTYRVTLAFV